MFMIIFFRIAASPPFFLVAIGLTIYVAFIEWEHSVPFGLLVSIFYAIIGLVLYLFFEPGYTAFLIGGFLAVGIPSFRHVIGFAFVGFVAGALSGGLYEHFGCGLEGYTMYGGRRKPDIIDFFSH